MGLLMATPQAERRIAFRALHQRDRAFLIPNPWDAGSARLLQQLGFEALATTSAGFAFTLGRPDGAVRPESMLEHAAGLSAATDLPVSADLENGYGDDPHDVAETIRLATETMLAGCSIEDVPQGRDHVPYELAHAADRIRAAAGAAHSISTPFMLTARSENFIVGRPDLRDTIARLQAFQDAGADVLYAPGLRTKEEIAAVVRAVDRPVNVLVPLPGVQVTLAELSELGVKRVSVGSALARVAIDAFLKAARELKDHGTFTFADNAVKYADLNAMFAKKS